MFPRPKRHRLSKARSACPCFTIILIFLVFTVSGVNCQVVDGAPAFSASQMGISTIALWPTGKISTPAEPAQAQPVLTVFRPQWGKANGTAVIIAPGGAYIGLALNIEGRQVADWYTARGVTAFVLQYRLGGAHPYPEPLLDGQRAVRVVRSMSKELHLHPDKIGFTGFSAGGHLAAMVATSADNGDLAATDPIDRVSDRPDFVVLGYPWLNAMQPNTRGLITYCSEIRTLTAEQCRALEDKYTPVLHISPTTPPTFLYGTTDDATVPAQASVEYYRTLVDAGVSAEMHLFRHGGHGSGLGGGDPALDTWPILLELWLRGQGFL